MQTYSPSVPHLSIALLYCGCCLVIKLCPTLCNSMDCSMPGFPVLHYLPKYDQTHIHWVDDDIQPSGLLLPSSPPALNLSQFQCWFFSPAQFSHSVMSNSLQPHGLQHARLPCPSLIPRACSNSCPWSRWCHPTISSSVVPLSYCLQSFPASGSYPMSQFFAESGQIIGVSASASVLPMNIQHWFPLGLTGLIFLQSTGLSRVFTTP